MSFDDRYKRINFFRSQKKTKNYKDFNVVIIKNKISLFFIDETLIRFVDIAYFIKLDFKNVYHKIWIREENEWKTTFRTRYELFEYTIMFFELIIVFVTFQTLINKISNDLINVICVIYLNNILIYFETQKKHYWQHVNII